MISSETQNNFRILEYCPLDSDSCIKVYVQLLQYKENRTKKPKVFPWMTKMYAYRQPRRKEDDTCQFYPVLYIQLYIQKGGLILAPNLSVSQKLEKDACHTHTIRIFYFVFSFKTSSSKNILQRMINSIISPCNRSIYCILHKCDQMAF